MKLFCSWMALIGFLMTAKAQPGKIKQTQLSHFTLQSSVLETGSGGQISSHNFRPASRWYPVKVPSTVLSGLVANKVYPSPYLGLNNMQIPDASDEFNRQYDLEKFSFLPGKVNPWSKPYWYRNTFNIPVADRGRLFQLILKALITAQRFG